MRRERGEVWKASRVTAGMTKHAGRGDEPHGRERVEAERTLSSALSGVLFGDFEITLSGKTVSVGAVLDDRERFHGALTLDPLEPAYQGGKVTGKLYLFGAQAVLHSFAHGGRTYPSRQPAGFTLRRAGRPRSRTSFGSALRMSLTYS